MFEPNLGPYNHYCEIEDYINFCEYRKKLIDLYHDCKIQGFMNARLKYYPNDTEEIDKEIVKTIKKHLSSPEKVYLYCIFNRCFEVSYQQARAELRSELAKKGALLSGCTSDRKSSLSIIPKDIRCYIYSLLGPLYVFPDNTCLQADIYKKIITNTACIADLEKRPFKGAKYIADFDVNKNRREKAQSNEHENQKKKCAIQ